MSRTRPRGGALPRRTSLLLALLVLAAPALAQGGAVAVPPPPQGGPPTSLQGPRAQLEKPRPAGFDRYQVDIRDWDGRLRVELDQIVGGNADLYVRFGAPPTLASHDFVVGLPGVADEQLIVDAATSPAIETGTWHIGVWRQEGATYDLTYWREAAPSTQAGMGATVYDVGGQDGTSFRVWAPNATTVNVAGTFNGWSSTQTPMASEGDGNWSVDVRNLQPGARYRYFIYGGGQFLWKNDPRALEVTNSVGDSIVVDPDAYAWDPQPYSTPAWNDTVIYELHVGTFDDTPGGLPGDFTDAIGRLDYLQDLGVTALEVMPVCEFAGDYSWGYNYAHPFAPEQAYGGLDGLKQFVDEAHQRGLAVLLDVLYNHWGPSDLDMWRFDGWGVGGYGGIYFYNDSRASTPWGDTRPDFGRGEVRQYVRDNVLYWLGSCRVDGLRWDSTSNIRLSGWGDNADGWSLMQWCNDEVDASQPWKLIIAEDMYDAPNEWITKTTGAGGAGFDAQWDATFVHPIRAAVETPEDNDRSMWAVRNAVAQYYNGDAFERVIYTESHDEVANGRARVPEEIWPGNASSWYSKKRSTLAAAVVMTAPGIPMLFQGQEILEDGYFDDGDPVDWNKLTLYPGIHQLYKDLIGLRRNLSGTTAGLKGQNLNVHHVDDGNKVIAWHRWDQGGPGDDVVVVCNFRNRTWSAGEQYRIGLPRAGTWHVRFNSDWVGYDPGYADFPSTSVVAQSVPYDGMPYSAYVSIGAYTAVILSQ